MSISKEQKAVYDVIVKGIHESGGVCPTYREIMKELEIKSTSSVARCIYQLESRGWIKRDAKRKAAIIIL